MICSTTLSKGFSRGQTPSQSSKLRCAGKRYCLARQLCRIFSDDCVVKPCSSRRFRAIHQGALLVVSNVGSVGVQPGIKYSEDKESPVHLGLARVLGIMSAAQPDRQQNDGDAPGLEALATESISPSRRESLKNLPKSGMHLGLGDRRGVLDSPVLLPLMTVRQQKSFALDADQRTQQAFTLLLRRAGGTVSNDWDLPTSLHSCSWNGGRCRCFRCSAKWPSCCPGERRAF